MPTTHPLPHVRAEWLPELLTGENHCEWAIWFRIRHEDPAAPPSSSDEDADPEHTDLLDQQKAEWADRGYTVSADSAFNLRGRNAVLTGTPELMVSRGDHVLIIGVPTGPPRRSHGTLVRLYMYGLRRAQGPYHGMVLPGELVYQDRIDRVPQGGVHQGLVRDLGALITRLVSDEPAARVPSAQECVSCDIAVEHCPVRIASPNHPMRQAYPGTTP